MGKGFGRGDGFGELIFGDEENTSAASCGEATEDFEAFGEGFWIGEECVIRVIGIEGFEGWE